MTLDHTASYLEFISLFCAPSQLRARFRCSVLDPESPEEVGARATMLLQEAITLSENRCVTSKLGKHPDPHPVVFLSAECAVREKWAGNQKARDKNIAWKGRSQPITSEQLAGRNLHA